MRGRIHPTIAAAVPTRIVKTNYCRAKTINTADLRLHPAARGNWTLTVAYSARVVCHGDLQDGAWQAPVFFNNPLMRQHNCAASTNSPLTHWDLITSWAKTQFHNTHPFHIYKSFKKAALTPQQRGVRRNITNESHLNTVPYRCGITPYARKDGRSCPVGHLSRRRCLRSVQLIRSQPVAV